MTDDTIRRYEALTEREKQVLRLLPEGHDAKSAARHLNLSVHTINERLRSARRKLGVSSSKEAARIVRQVENTPEMLGDKPFGAVGPTVAGQASAQPSLPSPFRRRFAWAFGAFAMIVIAAAIVALTTPSAPPAAVQAHVAVQPDPAGAAATAARRWLELGDAGEWDRALAATGETFRAANTPAAWRSVSEKVRMPLGRVLSRTLVDVQEVPTPPRGATVVRFRTDFANRTAATETLSLQREGDTWKVVGIYLE